MKTQDPIGPSCQDPSEDSAFSNRLNRPAADERNDWVQGLWADTFALTRLRRVSAGREETAMPFSGALFDNCSVDLRNPSENRPLQVNQPGANPERQAKL